MNLYELNNYLIEDKYISDNIYEYDIKQANINMLYSYGKISYETYMMLSNSTKEYREITVGKMIAYYDELYSTINDGIKESKKRFMISNNLKNENIVRISNDAVYVISPYPLKNTEFQLNPNINHKIKFACKNHFNCFVHLFDVLLFMDFIDDENINVDIKGLGKLSYLHEPFISFLSEIFFYKQRANKNIVIQKYMEFYNAYINFDLDISYYRELNSASLFRFKSNNNTEGRILNIFPNIYEKSLKKEDLDIGYNFNVLREVYSIII